ncbi:MAG: ribose 1,5-bisphosphate isomerase [Candidatus Methanofastidiosia archaeon]
MNEHLMATAKDISTMKIRGAGRIAVAAADALRITALESSATTYDSFVGEIKNASKYLVGMRPTAVSLPNAVRYVLWRGINEDMTSIEPTRLAIIAAAEEFISNAKDALHLIGDFGAKRLLSGDKILTVCNSNAAIEIIKHAHRDGKDLEVFTMETRPRYQGRITAKALAEEGIKVNLIIDSAARYFMRDMDHFITGTDAITANGAVVNKIGTAMAALAAHEARVRVMVAAETYKFHPETIIGELVEIEERPYDEVVSGDARGDLGSVSIRNPVFDITPSEYIDVIVTERGIIPPQASFFLLTELFGWRLTGRDPWE